MRLRKMNTPREYLATYLNDHHLAGAAAALEVLDARHNVENPALERFAHELRAAIAEDRDELMRLMRAANIETSHVRRAVGWIGEKAAELKLTLDDPADGGLRTFERLEILALGIDGKKSALGRVAGDLGPGAEPARRRLRPPGTARRRSARRRRGAPTRTRQSDLCGRQPMT